jgi:hypothetical protein
MAEDNREVSNERGDVCLFERLLELASENWSKEHDNREGKMAGDHNAEISQRKVTFCILRPQLPYQLWPSSAIYTVPIKRSGLVPVPFLSIIMVI